jgi:tetratricopeptide (TPR) repeat protein
VGENFSSTALAYFNLGLSYKSLKKYERALDYFKKSYRIYREIFGDEQTYTIKS